MNLCSLRNLWTLYISHELDDPISRKRLRHYPINPSLFLLMRSDSFTPSGNHRDRNVRIDLPDTLLSELCDRQTDPKLRPFSIMRFDFDVAAVSPDDPKTDSQPKPEA